MPGTPSHPNARARPEDAASHVTVRQTQWQIWGYLRETGLIVGLKWTRVPVGRKGMK